MKPWIVMASYLVVALIPSSATLSAQARGERSVNQPAAPAAKAIKLTGYVNSCYKPDKWIVFVTSAERRPLGQPPRFESESVTLGPDGRFTITLDPTKATPGQYWLNFGKTKDGAGGGQFTLKSDSIDFGEYGDCDV